MYRLMCDGCGKDLGWIDSADSSHVYICNDCMENPEEIKI